MRPPPPFSLLASRLRRSALRANLAAVILLACAIFAMAAHLAARHSVRVHWSRELSARLSDKSLRVLESIEADIRIVALVRPSHEAYRSTVALLQEYAAQAPNVSVEFVDPDLHLARAEQLAGQYLVGPAECVIVDVGGRHLSIPAADLIESGPPDPETAQPRRAFQGEPLFTRALYALTQTARPVVHFIQGHGERSPVDFDRLSGYSRIAARLRDENLAVETLDLGRSRSVPNHCALMVVAGPSRSYAPFEIALIRDYLNRKGRLLLLLDARTQSGLEPLLREWGVLLGNDVVVDESRTLSGRELHVTAYPSHPITDPLQGLASVFFLPRSIRPRPMGGGGDKPAVSELATCTAAGWAEFDPDDPAVLFDPQVDISGPVPVAVAIERGPVPGVHVQIRSTRLVVVGDSQFVSNGGLMGANADFFLNAVNWLLDRGELLALSPKTADEMRLVMDARQLHALFWSVVVLLPGLVAALGLWITWRRRR